MDIFQPIKLRFARNRLGLSMDSLTSAMGSRAVSKMTISKYERGILIPSIDTLHVLASACQVDISYFFAPDIKTDELHFRYKDDVKNGQNTRYEAQVKYAIEQRYGMESFAPNIPAFTNPIKRTVIRTLEEAEHAAHDLRHRWELGSQPIHSVYELLEEHGIMVIETDIPCEDLLGVSTIVNKQRPAAVINTRTNTTTERKRFTALHELGHLMMRIDPQCPIEERICHRFAGAMLIGANSMRRRLGEIRSDLSLKELISIRNMYGISIAATVHRAHDLSIIPGKTYDHLFDDVIKKNRMEEGWGEYPIMENADRQETLSEMIKVETEQ